MSISILSGEKKTKTICMMLETRVYIEFNVSTSVILYAEMKRISNAHTIGKWQAFVILHVRKI